MGMWSKVNAKEERGRDWSSHKDNMIKAKKFEKIDTKKAQKAARQRRKYKDE